ncbi:MAG: hypothetical protein ACI4M6_02050 [Christensenellaceae bacterium]
MDQFDILYRALKNVYEKVGKNDELDRFFDAVKLAPQDIEKLESLRSYCNIDEKWVEKIEKEIVYVEKAIAEERQFIIKNGEVLPIEKIKKVSDATVRHLARHANLITREPEDGKDIIPDKLYMVENLTDYAVYENRFLYLLLCYLRDFIAIRLDEITEVGNTYKSDFAIEKDIRYQKRRLVYKLQISDEDKNDRYSHLFNKSLPIIRRIKDLQSITASLLATPLMQEVSKVPMIRPPIVTTNVLKMNNNFVHALELYHYLTAYTEKGYSIEKIKNVYQPFTEDMLDKYSKLIVLNSFYVYVYGNKFTEMFEENLKAQLIAEEEEKSSLLQLKLEKLMEKHGNGYPQYVLELENRNRYLNGVKKELDGLKLDFEQLKEVCNKKDEENAALLKDLNFYKAEVDDKLMKLTIEQQEHKKELIARDKQIEADRLAYENKCNELKNDYDKQLWAEKLEFEKQYNRQVELFKKEAEMDLHRRRNELDNDYALYKQQNDGKMREYFEKCSLELTERNGVYSQKENKLIEEMQQLKAENERLKNERIIAVAELNALRQKNGLTTNAEDYTSKERFDELEEEFEAFFALFKDQWKQTKRRIRREILWKLKRDGEMRYDEYQAIEKELKKQPEQPDENYILDENFKPEKKDGQKDDGSNVSVENNEAEKGADTSLKED